MAPIALAFGLLELTGSTGDASIVIAAPILAQIAVLLVGGTLADRTSRKRSMVVAEGLAGASQLVIATLFITGLATVPALAVLMGLNGVAVALFLPAATGFIPQVVERAHLQSANSLLGAVRSAAQMGGAALAGVLVALFGAGPTIAIDGVTYLVSAVLLARIRAEARARTGDATLVEDLKLGWKEFVSHPWLVAIVAQFSVMFAAFEATFGLLGPAIARLRMNGSVDWGIIAASAGLGTVVGGIIAMHLTVERPMLVATSLCFLFCGTSLTLALQSPLELVALGAFIGGVAGQMFAVLWYTTLQVEIPEDMLSRVSAYDHLGSIALAPLGIVIAGVLFESLGPTPTLWIAVAAILLPTALVLLVPSVWTLESKASEPSVPRA